MKKGKKRLLLGWICLLLSLCMVTVASAETDGTPIQPCHQVTMTEQKSTAQSGASISVRHITTVLDEVNSELNALADDYAAELSPLLQKPGRERTQNSALTVRILHSRTGMSWMSFMVQARLEYHRQIQQVRFTTRTYDMLTGQRITLADIFPADSPRGSCWNKQCATRQTPIIRTKRPMRRRSRRSAKISLRRISCSMACRWSFRCRRCTKIIRS